jgi:hypothetical protein
MAAPDTSPRILPLANIVAIFALIGSIAFYLAPLTSSRPSVEPGQGGGGWGDQNIDARLWEDPIAACAKQSEQLTREQAGSGDRPQLLSSAEVVRERVKNAHPTCSGTGECSPVILAVMVPGGPYAEQVERRLRTRHGVVEGLSASHFTPEDYLHLGCFSVTWPPDAGGAVGAPATEPQLLVPYEWYQTLGAATVVIWLRDDAFAEKPLSRLASLLTSLRTPPAENVARDVPVAIIGPVTSNDLTAMWHDTVPPAVQGGLKHGEMYSPFASASETELRPATANATLAEYLAHELPGFHFQRTILTDDVIMKALSEELQRRLASPGGRIVLLAELDTVYGRALPTAFGRALPTEMSGGVQTFFYPAGLDGRVPSDQKADEAAASKQAPAQPGGDRPKEATEGLDQSDYLRRLAERLKRQDAEARWDSGAGIEAVGVLGADVFDKIMILRALRPSLPDAIFFTNTIDVRLGHPNEWDATHNLVVASPFGLEPVSGDPNSGYPPFRDSYETSVFTATLLAMAHQAVAPRVHLYEIGLAGPFPLDDPAGPAVLRWNVPRMCLLALTVLLIGGFGYWARTRLTNGEVDAGRRRLTSWVLEPLSLGIMAVLAVVILVVVAELMSRGGEPFAAFDGISIWPSEILRLLIVILAVHFIATSMAQIRASNKELTGRYRLRDVSGPRPDAAKIVDVVRAWNVHVFEGRFRARVKRIWLPALAYLIIVILLTVLLGAPSTPARGAFAWWANIVITCCAVLAIIFVLFFVNDAMVLNRRFIKQLMAWGTLWPPALLAEYRTAGVSGRDAIDDSLAEWLDIKFIADRTAVIEPLIYYPFVLLTMMIVSRLHYFDDWDLPLSLLVFFAINTVGAVFAAVTLRHSAELARHEALEKLRKWQFTATIAKAESDAAAHGPAARLAAAAQQAIDEIESIRTGAFGPLTENPIVGALLLPGGAGFIAAAQHFLFAH